MKGTITISLKCKSYEFYNVPEKIAKAVIAILDECCNPETEMISAESEEQA